MGYVDKEYLEHQFSSFWSGLKEYLPSKYAKGSGIEFSIENDSLMATHDGTKYKVCDLTRAE